MRAADRAGSVRRRGLLALTAVTAAATGAGPARAAAPADAAPDWRSLAGFEGLPGTLGVKLWAPATGTKPEVTIARNAAERMFVGSAIKAFVLCERMRQLDGPDILARLTATDAKGAIVPDQLVTLDASVWSLDSAVFNPPYLTGRVSERSAMEAMIIHSDDTATDMVLKQTGPDKVRAFLEQAGLRSSAVPHSTRSFFAYLLGAPDYEKYTWDELLAASKSDAPMVNPPLNAVQTLASSADDLVSFYARSVQGEFFRHPETLEQYRNVLSIGDVINLVPFPAGASAFAKGGSIDVSGFHALCIPGAMFFADRWVYFAVTLNWTHPGDTDKATGTRFIAATRDFLAQAYTALR